MKKILSILIVGILALGLVACGSKQTTKNEEKNKIYKSGEEVFIKDKNGKDVYSLKINEVKTDNDFEYKKDFPESNRKQIIEVTYNYKNIAKDDENKLEIHGADLKVMDSTGAMAESSDMFPKQKPQKTPVGANCTVQAYYGLQNTSDKVRVVFSTESYNTTIEFEVPVK
ncbi:lipoprotein [Clostridium botulinum]|uniref:Putative lipoprotein n=1 Tax=Clostridium botulinum (strain Okra / Type B1) TaxID=498213 RepID=B1IIY9_CLOBK|nr:lipoprotein [Clostridium botulinum]EKX81038.1 lipoprotein [Clostridium botulinum CFSAN001628]ABS33059.1 putative lipoprotein [Clostridium botulinum A str. ATCC 19397]ABS36486.1 putative lipoprotein [Clostridium botulinum A str. Hall]ACA45959.1 putative lipoprotein [Clostridium botulinum B1 str. Okra]MBD5563514.1 lipoprotein [Clostridium botulinum]